MTTRQLEIAATTLFALGAFCTLAFSLYELQDDAEDILIKLGLYVYCLLPFGLAAGLTRWLRASRRALIWLLTVGSIGTGVSLWLLADGLVLNPQFLSSLVVIILPGLQLAALLPIALVAWLLALSERPATA